MPPVPLDAEDARDEGREPLMAGMALEAALVFAASRDLAGPYAAAAAEVLLPVVLLLLMSKLAVSDCDACVVGGDQP